MQYHPKLKKAIAEIKTILDREDIAGCVILHAPQFSEFLLKIDPSYSCARFEGDHLRVKAKLKEDFNGDKIAWEQKVRDTSNMLHHLSGITGKTAISLHQISSVVDNAVNATHDGNDGETSHIAQNN